MNTLSEKPQTEPTDGYIRHLPTASTPQHGDKVAVMYVLADARDSGTPTVEAQQAACRRAAKRLGLRVDTIYCDTSAHPDEPGNMIALYNRLARNHGERAVDCVIVYKLDILKGWRNYMIDQTHRVGVPIAIAGW